MRPLSVASGIPFPLPSPPSRSCAVVPTDRWTVGPGRKDVPAPRSAASNMLFFSAGVLAGR
ncbi:hypothetical protein BC826DRAFT_980271 [Russula brevipes]|nr:hypothetical protein BC826DRAFT_980271 [Russula brevipes]